MNTDSFARNLSGVVLLVLIIAVPLAFLVSIVILRLYRRAVIKVMRTSFKLGSTASMPIDTSESFGHVTETTLNIIVHDSTSEVSSTNEPLHERLVRAPWRAAAIYAVAGVCYALALTIVFLSATRIGFHLPTFLMLFWYYAWPVAVTVCLVAAATWRTRLITVLVYFLCLVPIAVVTLSGRPLVSWGQILVLWLLTNLVALLVLLAFLNRRIRAVGPLVLTFMIIAVTGSVILPIVVGIDSKLLRPIIILGRVLGLDGDSVFRGLFVVGFIVFGLLGWLALRWIGNLYKQKKISEQSITIDAVWLLFGMFQSIGLIFEGERWFVASLMAFVVYKIVSSALFSFLGDMTAKYPKRHSLLFLRVFSLGKRSEQLFDMLEMHWKYVGSIRLITGPDLVTTTIEPHEFLDFLSGKLSRRFIDTVQTLDLRLSEMDSQPDRDGQFRVNDFFCYDDTWRMVLSRLVGSSDVVLMDLRGFSSQNAGCIFEINELINTVTVRRVVFIIDDTTDETFLRQVLQKSWGDMKQTSPNRLSTSGVLHLFRLQGIQNGELQRILPILSTAAHVTPEAQVVA